MRSGKEKSHRFHIEMSDSLIKELDQWKENGGLSSRKEVLSHAMAALRWMVRETQSGSIVVAVSRSGKRRERELVLPMLERIKARRLASPPPP